MITGADGHLGRAIADWLLQNDTRNLLLWVRADSAAERTAKRDRLAGLLNSGRCRIVYGDLTREQPFAGIDAGKISAIVHAAAAIDFNVSRCRAQAVNIDGSRRLLQFADGCGHLERIACLSTLYATGLQGGRLPETFVDDRHGFANHYEWSKWSLEALLEKRFRHLPWQILRVATILAENAAGRVGQHNVVHNTLRLLYYGLLSVVPGKEDTRIYLTTTEFVATACGELLRGGPAQQIYHMSDSVDRALPLAALLDRVYASFTEHAHFSRRRILKPLFCEQQAFELLLDAASRQSQVLAQALESVAPFAPQLFLDKQVETRNLHSALPGLAAPDSAALVKPVCDELIRNHWTGRHREGAA